MEGFSRIKDPMRLKRGDILYFPPRDREPKLALSLATFAKMGISMGNTRRAMNSIDRVKKMLIEHPGQRGFALMVGKVWGIRTWTAGERKFINLINNDGSAASNIVPKVRQLALHAIPVPGEAPDGYERSCMWKALSTVAQKYVETLGVTWDIFKNDSSGLYADRYLNCVFSGSPNESERNGLPDVPCTDRDEIPSRTADGDHVSSILGDWYGSDFVDGYNNYDPTVIIAAGRFVSECVRRGAILVRPSEHFLDLMARQLVSPAMTGWAYLWTRRLTFVAQFVANLNIEVKRAEKRHKTYLEYARKSAVKAVEKKRLLRESGKVFEHEHQLQLDGDRSNANPAPAER